MLDGISPVYRRLLWLCWSAGEDAYDMGVPREENPHAEGSKMFDYWDRGWVGRANL